MKLSKLLPILAVMAMMNFTSCSTESIPEGDAMSINLQNAPPAKLIEIEILEKINEHRITLGLDPLQNLDIIKSVAFSHTDYMIETDNVSHDNFFQRKNSLVANADAREVSENVAFAFNSAESVVNAWINSDSHRANIEGDFTDFDVSAEQDEEGNWYYTNIFIKR